MTQNTQMPAQISFKREFFIDLLSAGLVVRSYRFVRDACLLWLSHFPGDLKVSWFYARSLTGEGRFKQAITVLKGLCIADPESSEVVESMIAIHRLGEEKLVPFSLPELLAHLYALTGEMPQGGAAASWGRELWLARVALSKGRLNLAEESIRRVLLMELPVPIAAVTHLQLLAANPGVRLENKLTQVRRYRLQWPDFLAGSIYQAEWLMASGEAAQSVALIHQVAARDVAGQVASRIWGQDNPYRHLWPDELELGLEIPIPAEVSAFLGWNRLPDASPAGSVGHPTGPTATHHAGRVVLAASQEAVMPASPGFEGQPVPPAANGNHEPTRVISEDELDNWVAKAGLLAAADSLTGSREENEVETARPDSPEPELPVEPLLERQPDAEAETIISVKNEIEQLADRLHMRKVPGTEGRFPVYVVFTLRGRLEKVYGESLATLIQDEMRRLASTIARKRGWGGRLFIPDDPQNIKELGIKAPRPGDAWELKLALADLDAELGKKGEMIGALLIVGGPEIVPYHHLPNPLEDPDLDVPSDNPYATRDENYFIPEWPVGRLPGGSDGNPGLLLAALRRFTAHHAEMSKGTPWYRQIVQLLTGWIRPGRRALRRSFGYSAAIWQQAAASVFSKIGEPEDMYISPPCGLVGDSLEDYLDDLDFGGRSNEKIPTPIGTVGYFNLHGVVDAVEWFGHRDPLRPSEAPEFPIALRPQDLHSAPLGKQGGFPELVFSEACYGAHVEGKTVENSLALRFLEAGTLALVGSTCMSYGSIMGSLSAADLLAQAFWRFSQEGFPAGEALRLAKIEMIKQMDQEQGYLDGQDQKTLLSFILFGDPLAQPLKNSRQRKSVVRSTLPMEHFDIVCDRKPDSAATQAVPDTILAQVRQIVAQYLPGMSGAHVAFLQEQPECEGINHTCPTSQLVQRASLHEKNVPAKNQAVASPGGSDAPARDLVTLSKQFKDAQGTHPYYAHLTLEHGKLVKLVVSR